MSYEIIKGIKIDNKNKKIFLRSSSNNIYPKDYSRYEFLENSDNFEYKKYSLFYMILGGSANLRICDNKNWKYASYKFFDYCRENNIDTYDLWELGRKEGGYYNLKEYYDKFMSFVEEKHTGLYYIDSNVGYVTNITHQGFFYTDNPNKLKDFCYDYKKAYLNTKRLNDSILEKYDIKIKDYAKIINKDSEIEV